MYRIQEKLQVKFERTIKVTIESVSAYIDREIDRYIRELTPKFGAQIVIDMAKPLARIDKSLEQGLFAVKSLFEDDIKALSTDDRLMYLVLMNNLKERYQDFLIDDYFDKKAVSTIVAMTPKFQPKFTGAMFLAEGKKVWNDMVDHYITLITAELEKLMGSKLEGNKILLTTDAHGNKLSFCREEAEKMFEEIYKHFRKLGFEIWLEGKKNVKQVFPREKYDWEVKVIQS
jgi:hypothetical protein